MGGVVIAGGQTIVEFSEVETLNLTDAGKSVADGDLYVRTTDDRERITFTSWNDGGVKMRIDDFDNRTSTTYPQHFGLVGGMQMIEKLLVYAQGGDDIVTVAGYVVDANGDPIPAEFHGEEGNDYLTGANGDDILVGGPGNDRLLAGEGNNVLIGDDTTGEAPTDGDDRLTSGDGNDVMLGGGGRDYLVSGDGDDVLDGGTGDDQLSGGFGDDILVDGAGNDRLQGYRGNDVLLGGLGDDRAYGGDGNDLVVGGDGSDQLRGDDDDDTLVAGKTDLDDYSFNPLASVDAPPASNAQGMALLQLLSEWSASGDDSDLTGIMDDGLIDTLYDPSGTNTAQGTGTNDRIYGNF